MNTDSVTLAAQADLVLLTVEMLRSPQAIAESRQPPWFELSREELEQLLHVGLGAASEVADPAASRPSPRAALAEVHRCGRLLKPDTWSDEYWRMFDGATACPLNQASYIRRDKGTILGDLSGFYHAFGFQGSTVQGERPDHLLCQLEFVAMLLALASQAPDASSCEVVTEALSRYARDHMHDWLPSACWQMCEAAQIEYFGAVAQWVLVLWQSLTDFHAWPIDALPGNHLKPIVDPDDPYECGAPDLHQIQTG